MDYSELLILGFMALVALIILSGAIYISKESSKIKMFEDDQFKQGSNRVHVPTGKEDFINTYDEKGFHEPESLYDRTFQDDARNPAAMSAVEDYDDTRRLREGIGSSMSFGSLSDTTNIGSLGNDRLI